jgi:VanZ like protein
VESTPHSGLCTRNMLMRRSGIDAARPTFSRMRTVVQDFRLWIVVIALLTLIPVAGPTPRFRPCWLCGDRATSDTVANVILFLPLGLALSRRSADQARYRIPLLVSFAVETAQHFLPGRSPTYGDVLFNSVGGWLGIWLGTHSHIWWVASARVARRWFVLASGGAALILGATAFLVVPEPTKRHYFGHWTPEFRRLATYEGQLSEARIGEQRIQNGPLSNSLKVRAMILQNAPVQARGIAGPPPGSLAPVLAVSDDSEQMLFLLGIDGHDVVYRYRSRSAALRLDGIELRAPGLASAIRMGQTLRMEVRPRSEGIQFIVNGESRTIAEPNLGMGWQVLLGSWRGRDWISQGLNVGWLILLIAPLGYWARNTSTVVMSAVIFASVLAVLPQISWLAPTPVPQFLAPPLGAVLGRIARYLIPPGSATGFS